MFRLHWGPSWYQTKLCTWHLRLLSSIQVKVLWYSDAWYSSTGHLNLTSKSLFREESGNRLTSIWIPSYDLFIEFEEPNKKWPLSESTQAFECRNTIPATTRCVFWPVYIQWGTEIFEWSKRGWVANDLDFLMGFEIRKPDHLKSWHMAAILSKTIWNPNKNFWILNGWD